MYVCVCVLFVYVGSLRRNKNTWFHVMKPRQCKGMWGRKGSSQVAKMAPCTCASEFGNWRGSREGDSETDFQHFWHRGQGVGESQTPAAHPIWVPFWGSLGASTGAFWVLLGPVGPPWGAFNASLGCHFGQLEGQQGGG